MAAALARLRSVASPPAVFAGLAALVVVLALHFGRGTLFWFDEWLWIAGRRDWTAHVFLEPHNEHLSLVPVLVYKLLFSTAGIAHYWVYRVVLLVVNVACAWLVFLLVRRRLGGWEATIAAGLLLFLGRSYDNLIWPFQITYLLSIAFGLGALLALERADRRGDVVAAGLLAGSIASSGLGLPIAFGVAVELLAGRTLRRRWWVVGAPAALYALWYLGYGHGAVRYSVLEAPRWALDAAAAAFGSLVGQGVDWGRPLLVAAVVGMAVSLGRRGPTPRFAGVLATAVSFWLLTGVSRAWIQGPETTRYLYLGAVAIVLLAAEVLATGRRTGRALALAAAGLAVAAALSLQPLRDGGRLLRDSAIGLRSQLGALELARDYVDPAFVPSYGLVTAREYFAAFAAFDSSPALSPAELAVARPDLRRRADLLLQQAGGATLTLRPDARSPGGCRLVLSPQEMVLPRGGRLLVETATGETEIRVRRFGGTFANPPLGRATGGNVLLTTRADAAPQPWRVRLAPRGRTRVCPIS